jgi:hypothetical protein
VPLRACVENPEDCFEHAPRRNRFAPGLAVPRAKLAPRTFIRAKRSPGTLAGAYSFESWINQTALFFLRQSSRPNAPRPVPKSGSAAGSGTADIAVISSSNTLPEGSFERAPK